MTGLETLQSVQYATSKGKRFAVLDVEDWEMLIEWIETLEDMQLAQQAFDNLKAAGKNREKAGWLKWDDIKEELT